MNAALLTQPATTARISERVMDEWLVLEALLSGRGPGLPAERLLEANAALPRGIKLVLAAEQQACLRAELAWDDERASDEAKAKTIAELEGLCNQWPDMEHAGTRAAQPLPPASSEALKNAAAECGWTVSTRRDGSLAGDLEVPGRHEQVRFAALESGESLAIAEVAQLENATSGSRRAIATLMLLAGCAVRGARPALRTVEEKLAAVFEVCLPAAPLPQDLTDCLESLSLAVRLCGEEAKTFLNEQIARDYLEVESPASKPTNNQ